MEKPEAIRLIDKHKNALIDPCEMLVWTWLRVILLKLDDEAWHKAVDEALETLSK